MPDCEHEHFEARVNVGRLTKEEGGPVAGYTAEIGVRCAQCSTPFEFMGLPIGVLPSEPACSVDGTEARMPIRPVGSPDEFGRDLLGYHVRRGEAP